MTKKIIIGALVAAIAIPTLWIGTSAYNDYRIKNCTQTSAQS